MTDDFDEARKYYDMVKNDDPTPQDYLNMGHLAWVENRMADAIACYRDSMRTAGKSVAELRESISADFPVIAQKGIDRSVLPLIIDAVAGL